MIQIFMLPLLIALGMGLLALAPLLVPALRRVPWPPLLLPLALCLGFMAGYSRMLPQWWQPFPPVDSTRWLPFFLPLVALASGWQGGQSRSWLLKAPPLALLGTVYAWLVLAPMREQGWADTSLMLLTLSFGLGLPFYVILQAQPDSSAETDPATANNSATETDSPYWFQPMLALLLLGASGVLFLLGSSAVLAQQAWMLALLQLLPLILLRTHPLNRPALLAFNAFVLFALWLSAGLFSSASPWQALVLLSGLLPWLLLQPSRRVPPRLRPWLLIVSVTLVLGATLSVVWLSQPQDLYLG